MHNQIKCPKRQIHNQKSQNNDAHLNQDSLFPLFSHFNTGFPVQNLLSLDFQAFTKANFWFALVWKTQVRKCCCFISSLAPHWPCLHAHSPLQSSTCESHQACRSVRSGLASRRRHLKQTPAFFNNAYLSLTLAFWKTLQ